MELTKEILVDALAGAGTGDWAHSNRLTSAGLARFTGNQHNEEWQWERAKLMQLPMSRLEELYREVRPQYFKAG